MNDKTADIFHFLCRLQSRHVVTFSDVIIKKVLLLKYMKNSSRGPNCLSECFPKNLQIFHVLLTGGLSVSFMEFVVCTIILLS